MIHFHIFDMFGRITVNWGNIFTRNPPHRSTASMASQAVMLVMLAAAALGKTLVSAPPSSGPTKAMSPNKVVPSDVCWFVNPMNYRHIYLHIFTINHRIS